LYSAALLTLGAAIIHLAVAPAHLREYLPFGVFFLAVGSAQIVLAAELVSRPTRRLALLLAAGSLALVGLWLISRTSCRCCPGTASFFGAPGASGHAPGRPA
jgi:hypothetical protein